MAVGTVLAAFPGRRRRRPTDPVSAPIASTAATGRRRRPRPDRRPARRPPAGSRGWLTCSRTARPTARRPTRRAARAPPSPGPRRGLAVARRARPVRRAWRRVAKSGDEGHRRRRRCSASRRRRRRPPPRRQAVRPLAAQGQLGGAQLLRHVCVPCVQEHPELVRFASRAGRAARRRRAVHVVFNDDPRRGAAVLRRERRRLAGWSTRRARSTWRSASPSCPRRGSSTRTAWCAPASSRP